MTRESALVYVSPEDLINACLKQGESLGLSRSSILDAMRELLLSETSPTLAPSDVHVSFTHDKTKDGWKLLENVTEPTELDIKKFETISFLKCGEDYVNGEEMRRRSIEMKCNLGQQHAEYLLAHQNEIPKAFRKHYLVFPGTVWQNLVGHRYVPYLDWDGGRWDLYFGWLVSVWGGRPRLLSLRKPA